MKQLLQPLINGFYRILEVILVINMIIMFVLVFMDVVLRLGFNTGIIPFLQGPIYFSYTPAYVPNPDDFYGGTAYFGLTPTA